MAEPLDAELLKDLRGLSKPLSFDGKDAEYQDFRFSFRIHMSLVSAVSHTLMDKCEIERNPISQAAAEPLGDAHLKCCIQMYCSLPLITKGSVRTLVRSVEESNGAEAWRLIHSRYAPDTQNRQYALMEKIMMPAKLWCDHAEGLESGVRARELDVGKMGKRFWNCVGRCSQDHSDDEYGTDFSWEQFAVGYIRQQCRSSNSFVAMGLLFPKLWSESDRVSWKWNEKGKEKGKGKHHNQKGHRTTSTTNTSSTDINTCKNCGRTGHWAKDCWRPGGGAYDNSTRNNSNTQRGNGHKKGKGKSKHADAVETNQPSETASAVSYPSQTPSTIGELSCNLNVEPRIMGVTIISVCTRRQAGAEYLLLVSGAQLHACPIT